MGRIHSKSCTGINFTPRNYLTHASSRKILGSVAIAPATMQNVCSSATNASVPGCFLVGETEENIYAGEKQEELPWNWKGYIALALARAQSVIRVGRLAGRHGTGLAVNSCV